MLRKSFKINKSVKRNVKNIKLNRKNIGNKTSLRRVNSNARKFTSGKSVDTLKLNNVGKFNNIIKNNINNININNNNIKLTNKQVVYVERLVNKFNFNALNTNNNANKTVSIVKNVVKSLNVNDFKMMRNIYLNNEKLIINKFGSKLSNLKFSTDSSTNNNKNTTNNNTNNTDNKNTDTDTINDTKLTKGELKQYKKTRAEAEVLKDGKYQFDEGDGRFYKKRYGKMLINDPALKEKVETNKLGMFYIIFALIFVTLLASQYFLSQLETPETYRRRFAQVETCDLLEMNDDVSDKLGRIVNIQVSNKYRAKYEAKPYGKVYEYQMDVCGTKANGNVLLLVNEAWEGDNCYSALESTFYDEDGHATVLYATKIPVFYKVHENAGWGDHQAEIVNRMVVIDGQNGAEQHEHRIAH